MALTPLTPEALTSNIVRVKMNKLKIELDVNQWTYILNVLGQRPYAEVNALITEIQAQAKVDDVSVNE